MRKPTADQLLYDPMPREDVKLPPISEPRLPMEETRKLFDEKHREEKSEYLSNVSLGQAG